MRFLPVQYDASNRQFKPASREVVSDLEDGGTYLIVDLSPTDFIPAEVPQLELITAQSE